MGAGKTTLGRELAARLGREFVSVDDVVEERTGRTIAEIFDARGEAAFRELEEQAAIDVLARRPVAVVEIGGGGLGSERTRRALVEYAFTIHLPIDADEAWSRVESSSRPLASDPERFRALHAERQALYATADATASDRDGAVLAAAGARLGSWDEVAGDVVVADERVAELHGVEATHLVPSGEAAKTLAEAERLWRSLRLERDSVVVAVGGGSTLDLAGFVAATFLRGVAWIPVPTTLVGQVDAGIGGKVAIDLPEGKNLVGAFHWPARTVIDTSFLSTLPDAERANGLAEVVKTGLLAGERLWELEVEEQVRNCAAFKAAVCLRDPLERGERAQLNLGHTFAHALEAASGYALPHGQAVSLGLLAALRLSGLEQEAAEVASILRPEPASVDADAAWAALARDKKARGGRARLVLLEKPGVPLVDTELPEADVRAALSDLITGAAAARA